jgi:hypothetical protein
MKDKKLTEIENNLTRERMINIKTEFFHYFSNKYNDISNKDLKNF